MYVYKHSDSSLSEKCYATTMINICDFLKYQNMWYDNKFQKSPSIMLAVFFFQL